MEVWIGQGQELEESVDGRAVLCSAVSLTGSQGFYGGFITKMMPQGSRYSAWPRSKLGLELG